MRDAPFPLPKVGLTLTRFRGPSGRGPYCSASSRFAVAILLDMESMSIAVIKTPHRFRSSFLLLFPVDNRAPLRGEVVFVFFLGRTAPSRSIDPPPVAPPNTSFSPFARLGKAKKLFFAWTYHLPIPRYLHLVFPFCHPPPGALRCLLRDPSKIYSHVFARDLFLTKSP